MEVARLDPAGAGQAALVGLQRVGDRRRHGEPGEQARHQRTGAWRSRSRKPCTVGRMRAAIVSTPCRFGCSPSSRCSAAVADDAVEEERVERQAVALGERRDRSRRTAPCSPAPRLGGACMPASRTGMPRAFSRSMIADERPLGHRRVGAAQHVVGAEFEDHPVGPVRHRPVEPVEAAGGGVAGDAGIGDRHVVALGLEQPLQHGREGGVGGQPVAGGQAVAEGDELDRAARGGLRRRHERRPGPERLALRQTGPCADRAPAVMARPQCGTHIAVQPQRRTCSQDRAKLEAKTGPRAPCSSSPTDRPPDEPRQGAARAGDRALATSISASAAAPPGSISCAASRSASTAARRWASSARRARASRRC